MRKFDKAAIILLAIFGLLALVFGVGTIIHAYSSTKPRLAKIQEQAIETLRLAERAAAVLEAHPEQVDQLSAPRKSLVESVSNVHFVVQQTAEVSAQAADALDATAASLRSIPSASELFLPEDKLSTNAASLSQAADALRHLSPRLEALEKSTRRLTDTTTTSSEAAAQLSDEWVDARVTLGLLLERVRQTRRAVERAKLPRATARQVSLQGGLYILLSVVLFGMAGLWRRLCAISSHDNP